MSSVYQQLFFWGGVGDGFPGSFTIPAGFRCRIDTIAAVSVTDLGVNTIDFLDLSSGVHYLTLFGMSAPFSYLTNPRLVVPDVSEHQISVEGPDSIDVMVSGIQLQLP